MAAKGLRGGSGACGSVQDASPRMSMGTEACRYGSGGGVMLWKRKGGILCCGNEENCARFLFRAWRERHLQRAESGVTEGCICGSRICMTVLVVQRRRGRSAEAEEWLWIKDGAALLCCGNEENCMAAFCCGERRERRLHRMECSATEACICGNGSKICTAVSDARRRARRFSTAGKMEVNKRLEFLPCPDGARIARRLHLHAPARNPPWRGRKNDCARRTKPSPPPWRR